MTGASEIFGLFAPGGHPQISCSEPTDDRAAAETVVPADDPLFAAIVNERLTLSAAHHFDRGLLGERGT
jgi:hypothetical protein